jgi:predicted 2-oxoglutarate/Fe(II)-dependent dioxygenase YbiX
MAGTIKNLGGGVVVFEDAISVPIREITNLIDNLSDAAIKEQYEYVYDPEGKPIHAINKSGFIYQLDSIAKNPIRIQNLTDPFFRRCENVIYECLLEYIELFPAALQCLWWKSEGHVLRYPTGSSLGFHCDNDVNYRYGQMPPFEHATRNVISALVYINGKCDDSDCDEFSFTGGEMIIPYFDITIKPKSGTILFMPANYLGAHEIMEITSGSRYSYLSWFAQGSPQQEKGVSPQYPESSNDRPIGGQWWMPTLIADYGKHLMDKYGDEGRIPPGATPFKSRKNDHK